MKIRSQTLERRDGFGKDSPVRFGLECVFDHDFGVGKTAEVLLAGEDAEAARPAFASDYLVHHSGRNRGGVRFREDGDVSRRKYESRFSGKSEQV